MSSNVAPIRPVPDSVRVEDYLGPAALVRAEGSELYVEIARGVEERIEVRAELALAFPYEPLVGDVLLVIGKGTSFYVIGVLKGHGKSVITIPGDARIEVGGALDITAQRGVNVLSPSFEVHTSKLRLVAESAVETFTSALRRVRDLFTIQAGKSHTLVDDTAVTQAKSAAIVTKEAVTINGREVHLG